MRIGVGATGVAVMVAATAACEGGAGEGENRVVQLGEPEAVYPEPFAVVSTVREFEDGRVLVADPLGQVVVRLNLDAGTADTIGKVGEGPDEYRQPDAVWPLPGGRTLLVDLGNGRLTVLGPDLEFGETRPYAIRDPDQGSLLMVLPQGVDDRGRLYFPDIVGAMGSGADSMPIVRLDLETGMADSLGLVKGRKRHGARPVDLTARERKSAPSRSHRPTPGACRAMGGW